MEFRLIYRGELRSNGKPPHKHEIRKVLHAQLSMLWQQRPLRDVNADDPRVGTKLNEFRDALAITVDKFRFVPLVAEKLNLVCELDILLLRPEEPGGIVTQAGDVDNRLKTLFDALRFPKDKGEVAGAIPANGEDPFYCLLEDDNLLTRIAVTTDRLLRPASKNEVELVLHVRIKPTVMTHGNAFMIG